MPKHWCAILMAFLFCIQASPAFAENVTTLHGFTISFQEVKYDSRSDTSTWFYHIRGDKSHHGPDFKDLSNWAIGLCVDPRHQVVHASHQYEYDEVKHGKQHYYTIKFETPVMKDDQKGITFWFTMRGQWAADEAPIWVKAGKHTEQGQIIGPSCSQSCKVECNVISSRIDWRILKPGTYASKAAVVELKGNADVKLVFSEFGNATYLSDPTKPKLVMAYSIGDTLAEADRKWKSAEDFNKTVEFVPKEQVAAGTTITIWAKALLTPENSASDYESSGKISVVPLCK